MCIIDWSSDVCSSDLLGELEGAQRLAGLRADEAVRLAGIEAARVQQRPHLLDRLQAQRLLLRQRRRAQGRRPGDAVGQVADGQGGEDGAVDRKSVVQGKSVTVSVELGGGRIIK